MLSPFLFLPKNIFIYFYLKYTTNPTLFENTMTINIAVTIHLLGFNETNLSCSYMNEGSHRLFLNLNRGYFFHKIFHKMVMRKG